MGTRNLILVIKDKEMKVAQYCQWDGYPAGQGVRICRFLQEDLDLEKFKKALDECKFVDRKTVDEKWKECGAKGGPFVSIDVSERFLEKYPEFHRDTGARILKLIQDKGVRELENSYTETISTGIEYSYVIDVDKKKLYVYRGMVNLKRPKERLWKSYSFKKATPKAMMMLGSEEEEVN